MLLVLLLPIANAYSCQDVVNNAWARDANWVNCFQASDG